MRCPHSMEPPRASRSDTSAAAIAWEPLRPSASRRGGPADAEHEAVTGGHRSVEGQDRVGGQAGEEGAGVVALETSAGDGAGPARCRPVRSAPGPPGGWAAPSVGRAARRSGRTRFVRRDRGTADRRERRRATRPRCRPRTDGGRRPARLPADGPAAARDAPTAARGRREVAAGRPVNRCRADGWPSTRRAPPRARSARRNEDRPRGDRPPRAPAPAGPRRRAPPRP